MKLKRRENLAEFQARLRAEAEEHEKRRAALSQDLMQALKQDEQAAEDRSFDHEMGVDDASYVGSH
jgi:hypothetical protein